MTRSFVKLRRIFIHNVLHADDSPHCIALGVAIGLFVGLTPTVGLQMVIAVAVAAALRANKAVCVPMVWITNPVTMWPIYAICHRIGSGLIGPGSAAPTETSIATLATPLDQIRTLGVGRLLQSQFWIDVFTGLARLGIELWVGCLLVGFIGGTIGYFVSRRAIMVYRHRREARVIAKTARRAARGFTPKRVRAREPMA